MTDAVMTALTLMRPRTVEAIAVEIPEVTPGHVLVRVAFVGLCGADLSLFDGTSPYLLAGHLRYPFVFGHEWSGTIVGAGAGVIEFAPGDRVVGHNFVTCEVCRACRSGRRTNCRNRVEIGIRGDMPGAASDYYLVPAKVLAHVPDELPLATACLLEPGTTALHALERVRARPDDAVLILGTGATGLIATQIAVAMGATVTVAGIDSRGLELAREMGATHAVHTADVPADSYSVVVEASGAPEALVTGAHGLEQGGRMAVVGIAHRPVDGFPAAELTMKNASVEAVLSGLDFWDALIELAVSGRIRLDALIDQTFDRRHVSSAFEAARSPDRIRPKVLIDMIGGNPPAG